MPMTWRRALGHTQGGSRQAGVGKIAAGAAPVEADAGGQTRVGVRGARVDESSSGPMWPSASRGFSSHPWSRRVPAVAERGGGNLHFFRQG